MGEQTERRPVLEWRPRPPLVGVDVTVGSFRLEAWGGDDGGLATWVLMVGHHAVASGTEMTLLAAQLAAEDAAREAGIAVPANPPKTSDGCEIEGAGYIGDLGVLVADYLRWCDATFPGTSSEIRAGKLLKEARELDAHPDDPEEMVDCLMLALHCLHRSGFEIVSEFRRKHEKNKARTFERTPDGDYQHVRADREDRAFEALLVAARRGVTSAEIDQSDAKPSTCDLPDLTHEDHAALDALGPDLVERIWAQEEARTSEHAGLLAVAKGLLANLYPGGMPVTCPNKGREDYYRAVRALRAAVEAAEGQP